MYSKLEKAPHIKMIKPIGYLDFLILQSHSKMMITDSGGIQEEAITLNVPCLTLRYNTERPETVHAGGNILVGADTDKITKNVAQILDDDEIYRRMKDAPNPYGDGSASEKILDAIFDTYNKGSLDIKPPEKIEGEHSKQLLFIDEKVTVAEFENKNPNSTITLVFTDGNPSYPHSDLSLKGKTIIISN
jgi:UDP-N-acetylglucosamine 2-epimerase (non-hydrolysing)